MILVFCMKTRFWANRPLPDFPHQGVITHLLILSAVTLLLLFSGAGQMPLIDRDEPRFAQATREMMQRHDVFIPWFNGEYRFDKPPLIYWLMSPFYALFGTHELCARLPAILTSWLLVLATYWGGRTFFNGQVGFLAGLGLATCFQLQIHGRLAVADLPMILFLTVSQLLLLRLLTKPEQVRPSLWFWAFYLCQAAGFLAKGPIVLVVTILTLLFYRFVFWRQPLPWHLLRWPWGLPVMIGIIGLWGIPALLQTEGLLWKIGMGRHVVARGMESFDGRPYFVPYYFITAFLSLCPWAILLGYAWRVLRRNWNQTNAFLCAWAAAPYLVFTLYSTQLPHYVLPAFPALFLILGQIAQLPKEQPAWVHWWARGVLLLYVLISLALLGLVVFSPWTEAYFSLRLVLLSLWGFFTGLLFLGLFFRAHRWRWLPLAIGQMAICLMMLGSSLRTLSPALVVGEVARELPPESRFVARGFSEPSLVFYTNRQWQLDQSLAEVQTAFNTAGPCLVVVLEEERKLDRTFKWLWSQWTGGRQEMKVDRFTAELESLPLSGWKQRECSGLNLARSSWVRVKIFWRE